MTSSQTQHSIRGTTRSSGTSASSSRTWGRSSISTWWRATPTARPFNRDTRSIIYERAKGVTDTKPFGTEQDVYAEGYTYLKHSIATRPVAEDPVRDLRITVGGPDCTQPYSLSVLNISAMSFGALGGNAVLAMNTGAKLGNFAHDTGEGGISRYHRGGGGDLIWQIGTGYFGCRSKETGGFDPDLFAKNAVDPQIKMIEIKMSQGAKPGHGGILPGAKVTEEIAEARLVEVGKTVFSPTYHQAFSTPLEMCAFIAQLRELSGGKPVGFKICIGEPREFMAIVKAMMQTGIYADFIVVDGGEGGTGAAPQEFSNSMGFPLLEGLAFVHNTLVGAGIRDQIKVGASGKMVTASAIATSLALGADWCNSARAFMFSVGCIQAQRCNTNSCPVGVTTQDPKLQRALDRARQGRARPRVPQEHGARARGVRGRHGPRSPERARARITSSGASARRRWRASTRSTRSSRRGQLLDGTRPGAHAALLERVDGRDVPVRPEHACRSHREPCDRLRYRPRGQERTR